ncbi:ATP-binding protein [Aquincola sp. MAHUQ-54]|uniref:histidine kinase n=1 Tax=Aquincola agrisoli TaxID=3119538 RepID=A0AAW9QAH3_9BURK
MKPLHILHLEDDAMDADLVQREVARLGGDPTWLNVGSAEEFFDALENVQFDAILSDNSVPGIDGLSALQVARQRLPGIPFVFVSGNGDPRWAEHCIEAGATDYVQKGELWRLPSALQRLRDARESARLATLTRARALLVDLVKELSHARSVEVIAGIVRRGARALNRADGATFVLRDGDQCHYVDEDAIGPLWKGSRFPLTSCVSGWAMLNRQAAIIPDIYDDPRVPHDAYRPTFVKSLVMVPIRAEAPIGAIGNYWATAHEPTQDEVELIQALADCTSLAFENVAAYEGLERRVRQRTAELQEVNQELEAFTYSVSHDLRAPLRAVQGYSDLLLTDSRVELQGQTLTFVRNIHRSAQKMHTLIEDMLSLSKIKRAEVRMRPVALDTLAREIIDTLQAGEPDRSVQVDIEPGLMAQGDPGLLRIALQNLLANAWKFTGKRADAAIGVSSAPPDADGRPVYCVSDNGAGFDMAHAQQLFEPFRRLHREADFPGTGVGLAIVHRVIHKHGGHIWVDAARHAGARFYFMLPGPAAKRG